MSVDPLEQEEVETVRVAIDLPKPVADFLEQYAAYRNALNKAQGRSVDKTWTRKSGTEAFVMTQYRGVIESMKAAFDAAGPLPSPKDEKAMLAYAKAVLASTEKPKKR